ncbi:Lysophosphatidylcholine acyltransferase like protein [Verticillium longisporum]|nr:Lysophosphatidylcholine acyltransferase like protein [Verticillium longisporum]
MLLSSVGSWSRHVPKSSNRSTATPCVGALYVIVSDTRFYGKIDFSACTIGFKSSAAPVLFSLPSLFKHLHFKYTQSQCHLSQHHSMARGELQPLRRSLAWRLSSSVVMGLTGAISRAFLYGLNDVQTEGLKPFLKLLDERQGVSRRQGLITVSNHISVLDDPVTWGVLPLKYAFKPRNLRWGLGAHDMNIQQVYVNFF